MKGRTALAHYLARCGAVRVQRDNLPVFAKDLGVRFKDLERSLEGLEVAGQVRANGGELLLSPPIEWRLAA